MPVNYLRGLLFLGLREYDRAADQLETAAAIIPLSPSPHEDLLRIYWLEGRVPEALAEQKKVALITHDPAFLRDQEEVLAVYTRAGLHAAQLRAAQLRERSHLRNRNVGAVASHNGSTAFAVVLQYALLGDRNKTL